MGHGDTSLRTFDKQDKTQQTCAPLPSSLLSPSHSSARAPTRTVPTRTSTFVSTRPSSLQASRSFLTGILLPVICGSTLPKVLARYFTASPSTRLLTPLRRQPLSKMD